MNEEPGEQPEESAHQQRASTGQRPLLGLARVLALIAGLSAAAIGVLLGGLFILGSALQGEATLVAGVTFSLSLMAITIGLGLAVAWHAIQAMQGRPSRPFRPPRAWPLVLLFLLAVAGGQIILSLDLLPVVTFPLFHLLAATLPPLAILFLAGRALGSATRWREVILQLGMGALISTPLALALEAVLIIVLVLMAAFSLALRPGGPELLGRLAQLLETAPMLEDPEALLPLLLSPAIIAGITAITAGAVPLVEEAVKAIGVPLLAYRRPNRSQALLWGLACGAGFGLVEGLLNTVGDLGAWALVVVFRLGATLLHCLTGGLMGLAWYQGLRRRWWRALGLYAGSIAIHGFWNLLSVGVAYLSLGAASPEATSLTPILAGLSLGLIAALAGTALALALGLALLLRHLRRHPADARQEPRPVSMDVGKEPATSPASKPLQSGALSASLGDGGEDR